MNYINSLVDEKHIKMDAKRFYLELGRLGFKEQVLINPYIKTTIWVKNTPTTLHLQNTEALAIQ